MDIAILKMAKNYTDERNIYVKPTNMFADTTERNAYFTANPTELESYMYIQVASVVYRFVGVDHTDDGDWQAITPVIQGEKGDTGATGAPGAAGAGIIPGGTAGQVLQKIDGADYNTQWAESTDPSHTHGNITNDGKVGAAENLPLITGAAGVVQASSFGTAANTFCEGDDSRLGDARTPSAHDLSGALHNNTTLANLNLKISDATLIDTADSRLGDERTPANHNLIDTTKHPVAGLTAGHFLKASAADAYGFAAHGLTATDVGLANVTNHAQLPLAGGTMSGELIMADQLLTRPKIKDYSEAAVIETGITGNKDIDLSAANYHSHTYDGDTVYTDINAAASGSACSFTLKSIQGGTLRAITWFEGITWAAGAAPTMAINKIYLMVFTTDDAGVTWLGALVGEF